MLAPKPSHRPFMWEIQMDLYEILKPYDDSIPKLKGDLCVPPSLSEGQMLVYSHRRKHYLPSEIDERMETPLH